MFTGRLLHDLPNEILLNVIHYLEYQDILNLLEIPDLIEKFCCYVYNPNFTNTYFDKNPTSKIKNISSRHCELSQIRHFPIVFAELKSYDYETLGHSIKNSDRRIKKFIIYNGKYTDQVPFSQRVPYIDQIASFLPILELFVPRLIMPKIVDSFSIVTNRKNYSINTNDPSDHPLNLKLENIKRLSINHDSYRAFKRLKKIRKGHVLNNINSLEVGIRRLFFQLDTFVDFNKSLINNLLINIHVQYDRTQDHESYFPDTSDDDEDEEEERYLYSRFDTSTRISVVNIRSDTIVKLHIDMRRPAYIDKLVFPKLVTFSMVIDDDACLNSKVGSIIAKNLRHIAVSYDRMILQVFDNSTDFGDTIDSMTLERVIKDENEWRDWPAPCNYQSDETYLFKVYNSVKSLDVSNYGIPFFYHNDNLTLKRLLKLKVRGTMEEFDNSKFFDNFTFPNLRELSLTITNNMEEYEPSIVSLTIKAARLRTLQITGTNSWVIDTSDIMILINIKNNLITRTLEKLELYKVKINLSKYEFCNLKELVLVKVFDIDSEAEDKLTMKNNEFPKLEKLAVNYAKRYIRRYTAGSFINDNLSISPEDPLTPSVVVYLPESLSKFTGLVSKNCKILYPSDI